MDDVERMYRHLVRTIRASAPQLLTQPFAVSDLYTTILPYRLHRRELGVETNQDYELAMLELISGARGFLTVDARMRDALVASLRSPNPDPALIREFASARVALAPDALRQLDGDVAAAAPPPTPTPAPPAAPPAARDMREADTIPVPTVTPAAGAPAAAPVRSSGTPRPTGTTASAPAAPARRPSRPITVPAAGEECPHCKGALPAGRQISFCPHCGQDLTVQHCPACGSELEHEWKFCVTCGRAVSPS